MEDKVKQYIKFKNLTDIQKQDWYNSQDEEKVEYNLESIKRDLIERSGNEEK